MPKVCHRTLNCSFDFVASMEAKTWPHARALIFTSFLGQIPYFLDQMLWLQFISLFQCPWRLFEGGYNLRAATIDLLLERARSRASTCIMCA